MSLTRYRRVLKLATCLVAMGTVSVATLTCDDDPREEPLLDATRDSFVASTPVPLVDNPQDLVIPPSRRSGSCDAGAGVIVLGGTPFGTPLAEDEGLEILLEYHAPPGCRFISATFEGYQDEGTRWHESECRDSICGPRVRRFFYSKMEPIGPSGYALISSFSDESAQSLIADGFVLCYAVVSFNDGIFGGSFHEVAVGENCLRGDVPGHQAILEIDNRTPSDNGAALITTQEGVTLSPDSMVVARRSLDGPCNSATLALAGESPVGNAYTIGDDVSVALSFEATGCTDVTAWFFGYYPRGTPSYKSICQSDCGPLVRRDFFGGSIKFGPGTGSDGPGPHVVSFSPPDGEIIGPRVGVSLEGFVLCYVLVTFRGSMGSLVEERIGSIC